jgi:hypothetical protein
MIAGEGSEKRSEIDRRRGKKGGKVENGIEYSDGNQIGVSLCGYGGRVKRQRD